MIVYGMLTEKETSHQNRVNSEQQTSPAMITTSLKLNARLSGPVHQCGHCWVNKKMQLNFMFASRMKLYEQKLVFQVIWYLLTSHDLLILMAYVCKSFSLILHMIYLCFTYVLLMIHLWFTYILLMLYLYCLWLPYANHVYFYNFSFTYDLLMFYLWLTYDLLMFDLWFTYDLHMIHYACFTWRLTRRLTTHFAIYLWSTYHRLILLTTYLYKSCSLVWLMI